MPSNLITVRAYCLENKESYNIVLLKLLFRIYAAKTKPLHGIIAMQDHKEQNRTR